MDKKPFDFKDLMAFGMFILALLTFVFWNVHSGIADIRIRELEVIF